jgi:hypothetical protein
LLNDKFSLFKINDPIQSYRVTDDYMRNVSWR